MIEILIYMSYMILRMAVNMLYLLCFPGCFIHHQYANLLKTGMFFCLFFFYFILFLKGTLV